MVFLTIVIAYVFFHGVTAMVITPVQSMILPHETVFASLIYLPHGVRVLATWAFGWKAIPPLLVGTALSVWIYSPPEEVDFLSPALLEGIMLGSVSAFLAFELARSFGYNLYFGHGKKLSWVGMVAIGALASVINSIGQTLIYSGLIGIGDLGQVLAIFAIGDLVGLVLCMGLLMLVFRWRRAFKLLRMNKRL